MQRRSGSIVGVGCAAVLAVFGVVGSAPVAAQEDPVAQAAARRCADRDGMAKAACYEEILLPLAEAGQLVRALGALEALARLDPQVRRDGHMYVHGLGIAAHDPERDPAETFTECTELFHAGCYHGVIQAYFAGMATIDSAAVNGLCTRVRERRPDQWTYFQCVHGLGHGLTIHEAHDLVDGLAGCDLLVTGWERESCYGGAFMENVGNATMPHHNSLASNLPAAADHAAHGDHAGHQAQPFKAIDPADPHYPCTIVAETYLAACYGMQTTVILHLNGQDFAAAARTCDGAPDAVRRVCHQSLGRDASGFAEQNNAATLRLCAQDRSADAPWCYVGAVKAITDWTGRPDPGHAFCALVDAGPARVRCFEALGEQIGVMVGDPEGRRASCSAAPGRYADVCQYGARVVAEKPALLRELDAPGHR